MLMFQPLKKYADFQGRARRSEYWLFFLFNIVVTIVLETMMFSGMANGGPSGLAIGLLGVFFLAMIVPSIAVAIRRLHDTNRSGWWLFLGFVPLLGLILIIFMLLDGTPGPNPYGEDPKGRQPLVPSAETVSPTGALPS